MAEVDPPAASTVKTTKMLESTQMFDETEQMFPLFQKKKSRKKLKTH